MTVESNPYESVPVVQKAESKNLGSLRAGASILCFLPLTTVYFHLLVWRLYAFLPEEIENYFFFLPQFAFPYGRMVIANSRDYVAKGMGASALNIVHWAALTILFALVARRLKNRYLLLATAFCVVLLSPWLTVRVAHWAGYWVLLDSP